MIKLLGQPEQSRSPSRGPRGATRVDPRARDRRNHLWLVGALTLGVAVVALGVSSPQEAATLPVEAVAEATAPAPQVTPDALPAASDAAGLGTAAEPANPAAAEAGANVALAAEIPTEAPPLWREETVRTGDNLSLIFARAGFSDRDVLAVTRAEGGKALRRIYPGETIAFRVDADGTLDAVRHVESRLKATLYQRGEAGFERELELREPEARERGVTMTIRSSLFKAGTDADLSNRVIMDLANIFGGVIDFALDPRVGDRIELLYEERWLDGQKVDDGDIIAAAFTNQGKRYEAYRFTDAAGDTAYYNEAGVSMRKAFLKAPVDFTRVSSNFNPNRLHPIYKTKRPHRGTDYAAPRGTPVYAAGDGKVVKAGYTRANGNYVFIQHGEQFKTHYLHLHKKAVREGERVRQGQVIGTVGSTGAATGPHLHYEFLVNGVHHNPRTVHKLLPKARSLPDAELPTFKAQIQAPLQQLAAMRADTKLALAQ